MDIMFADDIIIDRERKEWMEENQERWRYVLGRGGMKLTQSGKKHMCVIEELKRSGKVAENRAQKKGGGFQAFLGQQNTAERVKKRG